MKAQPVDLPEPPATQIGELVVLGIPLETYKALSDYGKKHGMTAGEVLVTAIRSVLKETPQPRTLVEQKGA